MNQQLYQQLLSSLGGSTEGTQAATMGGLLEQLSESNPQLKLLTQYMAQQQALASEDPEEDILEVEAVSDTSDTDRRQATEHLRRLARRMYGELEELRQRNDILAEALGACYLCWGEDRACSVCNGQGQPGSMLPDKLLFAQYVAPAVRALRPPPGSPSPTGRQSGSTDKPRH